MYATLFISVGRNIIIKSNSGGGINDHASLGESGKLLLAIGHKNMSGEWREW